MTRIQSLSESPCYKCPFQKQCDEKLENHIVFESIKQNMFQDADKNYKNCSLYKAINLKEEE